MAVPLLDLNAQNLALEAELKAAFERVLRSGQFILGPEAVAFEKELAQMIGAFRWGRMDALAAREAARLG